MYETASDVPVPEPVARSPRGRFPIETMKVGDSFVVPDATEMRLARIACSQWKWRGGMDAGGRNYTSRMLADGTGRVWRTG